VASVEVVPSWDEYQRTHVSDRGRTHIGDRATCISRDCIMPDATCPCGHDALSHRMEMDDKCLSCSCRMFQVAAS